MRGLVFALGLSITLIASAIYFRPILPIDETRYLSVAWEMKWRGDFLVSHMSGETYSHKPPLLFWLINAVWAIFGEYETLGRVVAPGAGLVSLILLRKVARGFWPDDKVSSQLAPVILAATFLWTLFLPMTMFDTLVTMSMLIAVLGLQSVTQEKRATGWALTGLGIGLGLLAKGPVILLFVLPGSIAIAWWRLASVAPEHKTQFKVGWIVGTLTAVALGAAIVLSWAIPSAILGGSEYASDLFFGQTAGRMVKSFAHKRPIYWFLPFVPICLLPWIAYRPAWHILSLWKTDRAAKSLLMWCACTFVMFSLISGKQLHYILPLASLAALLIARGLSQQTNSEIRRVVILPVALGCVASMALPLLFNHVSYFSKQGLSGLIADWTGVGFAALGVSALLIPVRNLIQQTTVVATSGVLWTCLFLAGTQQYWRGCDLTELAMNLAEKKQPIAWFGDNQAQLNFIGRIQSVDRVEDQERLTKWLDIKADGLVVFPLNKVRRSKDSPPTGIRTITEADREMAKEITTELLRDRSDCRGELVTLFTRNRELYTEDYLVFQITKTP